MKIEKSQFILLVPVIIVITAVIFFASGRNDNANYKIGIIEIDEVDVASKIPGRIESLNVKEGDKVIKGQVLAKLESKELDAKVEQARGAMKAAKSKLDMAYKGARDEEKLAAEKLYMQAKHQYEFVNKTKERFSNLYKDSVISSQEYDEVVFKYNAAKDQMEAAEAKYNMVMKGARDEEIRAAEGLFHQAENAFNEAMAYYNELELVAPIDGEISKKIAAQGEIIASGYPVFTVINPNDYYVVLQIREDELGEIKMGKTFNGIIPALQDKEVEFKVIFISPMGDFATWKPTNQKGDFDLKTFEVHLKSNEVLENIRPGMTVKINL
jgi:HlyD family secretion protein